MIGLSTLPFNIQTLAEFPQEDAVSIWDAMHKNDPSALPTQSLAWFRAASQKNGRNASRIYSFSNGQQIILPLLKFGVNPLSSVGSMPEHWGYGGLISRQEIISDEIAHVWHDLQSLGWQHVRIRPNPLQAKLWENGRIPQLQSIPKCAHVLDLQDGFDTVWSKKFKSNMRRNVRKAEKSGLTVEWDVTGRLVPQYYQLFETSVLRWAEQQNEPAILAKWRSRFRDPISKIQTIMEKTSGLAKMWLAKKGNEPVAAIIVLQGQNFHYTRGVMNKALANKTRANEYLHFLAIQDACETGSFSYHMGETGHSKSLAQFKEKFGARPFPYATYYLERLPLTAVQTTLKTKIKKVINFKDTT